MANDMTLAFADARGGTLDCRPKPVCDPRPVCPACGGLECLCRPRFFAGQLLTEEDLNRLDYYIVAKNRLHNRHLFGTGVVCGLEVVCSACDPAGGGSVIVKPGYALTPCGNDAIVCKEESVNVCDLINRCRPRPPDDCFQPGGNTEDCQQGNEQWVLAICYQERQTRGITALRGASCTCGGGSGCTCGGKTAMPTGTTYMSEASCGCEGGTTTRTAKTKPMAKAGPVPPQCEPTLVCEGYTFAVYKVPKKDDRKVEPGALIKRFLCCLQPLFEQLEALPKVGAGQNPPQEWVLGLIATVREFLIAEGLYDCDVAAKLSAVALPSLGSAAYQSQWSSATLAVLAIVAAIFQKCLCAALLPPCPPAEMNDCVPIATLTVARGHCRVRQICNIGNRRFLLTFPAIEYWLSWLPLFAAWQQSQSGTQPGGAGLIASSTGAKTLTLRELIDRLCCTPITDLFNFGNVDGVELNPPTNVTTGAGVPPQPGVIVGGPTPSPHPFTQLLAESFLGAAPKANAATLLLAAMGARNKDGSALVSDAALANPGQAMLVQQVLGPALTPLLGGTGGGVPAAQLNALANVVETLRTQVQEIIDKLAQG